MRAVKFLRPSAWKWAAVPLCALLLAAPARADRLPLPQAEQAEVNRAIDQGVQFLKQTQLPSGTWKAEGNNLVGYAALPGLTLLECGVPPDDPAVKKAASFVRRSAQSMDRTYDLALSILFLDKLGDPKDEKLIQTLALRLVAGQAATGGWGYKCPLLPPEESHNLLLTLRKVAPGPSPIPLMGGAPPAGIPVGGAPDALGRPADNAGAPLAGGPAVKDPGLTGAPTRADASLGGPTRSPGEAVNSRGATIGLPADPPPGGGATRAMEGRDESLGSRRWAWCIKSEEEPPDAAPAERPKAKPAEAPAQAPRPLVVPAEFRRLTVFQDFSRLLLQDPQKKEEALVNATTDNSNTQFAILGLWTAQRHDVPMDRTLRLVANRFQTSQNPDGSWGYHYVFGGGEAERAPMDCVGLLGLAVGHGLARAGQGAAVRPQDPQILNGFAALSRQVGVPAGRTRDLPIVNLYLLWSIERVAVLYDLATIADKDWYRWGAEILIANQSPQGEWADGGGYYNATAPINTSFALLFLRRANLVSDLTAVLPFKPEELNKDITEKVTAKETKPADAPAAAKPTAPPTDPAPASLDDKPTQPPAAATSPAPPAPDPGLAVRPQGADGGGRGWLAVLLIVLALMLLAAGTVLLALHFRNRKKAVKVSKNRKPKKVAGKPPAASWEAASRPRKRAGKTRLPA